MLCKLTVEYLRNILTPEGFSSVTPNLMTFLLDISATLQHRPTENHFRLEDILIEKVPECIFHPERNGLQSYLAFEIS